MSIGSRIACVIAACLLCINAGEAGQEKLVQKVYQVADLVIVTENCPSTPVPKVGTPACVGEAKKMGTVAVVVSQHSPSLREIDAASAETPDEAGILRAMTKPMQISGLYEESRDNIQIVTERLAEKMDAPRFFPLVGPARLSHCHWKCTVYYTETIQGNYPFSFQWVQPRTQVVYVDSDQLHVVRMDDTPVK